MDVYVQWTIIRNGPDGFKTEVKTGPDFAAVVCVLPPGSGRTAPQVTMAIPRFGGFIFMCENTKLLTDPRPLFDLPVTTFCTIIHTDFFV